MTLGNRLRILRCLFQLTQSELCELLYISQSNYSQWENDEKEPKHHRLVTLAKFYSVSTDFLLTAEKIDATVTVNAKGKIVVVIYTEEPKRRAKFLARIETMFQKNLDHLYNRLVKKK